MAVLVTLALNGMLGLGGYWAARHAFRQPAGPTRWVAAATLAWAWATVGLEALGASGVLSRGPMLLWSASGLAIGLFSRRIARHGGEAGLAEEAGGRWEWEAVVALGLAIWSAIILGVPSFLLPVKVQSDGPIYHLYFAARWWKAGRLFPIATPFGENAATYFPVAGDLWFTWLTIGWGGDRLAKVGQSPFTLMSAVAAYAMARRVGAGASSAMVATAWFAASTAVMVWSFEPNVDMIFVAGYLSAALFFLRYATGDDSAGTLSLGALAAGGALGTKAPAVVFVPPLLLLGLLAALSRPGPTSRRAGRALIVLTVPMVMAGYGYGRNLILTGNPLYPLHVSAFGRVWLPGWYGPDVMRRSQYYIPMNDWRAGVDILLVVLDPRLAPVWAAAVAGAWALGRSRPRQGGWAWACSGLAALNVALYWIVIPYRSQQRFMLHALGLAVVPLARLFDRGRWVRVAGVALLAMHVFTANAWPLADEEPAWDLSRAVPNFVPPLVNLSLPARATAAGPSAWVVVGAKLAIGTAAFAIAWAWAGAAGARSTRRTIRALAVTAGLLGVVIAVNAPRGVDPRQLFLPPFPEYIAGWMELDARSGPDGTRIAYAGTNMPYFLMGAGLRNEVRYVNVDEHRDWLLHDYRRAAVERGEPGTWPTPRPGWDRLQPDYDAWLANLRSEGIRILVVAKSNPIEGWHNVSDPLGFPIERGWAESHPESFEPLYGVSPPDPEMRIYRVRRSFGPGRGSRSGGLDRRRTIRRAT